MAMTFNWTCWIFSLLVMFNISIIDGQQCQYPADWQGPQVHWFTKYSTAGTMVGTRFRLDTEEDVVFSSANDVTVTGDWDCLRGGQDESSYRYYLRRNGSETQCVRLYKEGKGLLLVRTTFTAIESTPLSTCIQIFGTLNTPLPLDVLVRNPGVFDFTNNNCQLPAGLYQTQLSTVSGENACAGNKQSTALITRDTILFKLCINEDSYLSPYRSELQCVATMEEISIGDSPTSSHGGVVILAHTDKTTGRVSFYCGRYLKTGNNFLMSLVTSKDGSVHCKPTVNYVYVAPGIDTQAKAYMMSALSCSPGVCENGATCIAESPQLIRCACLPGYTGFFCEKAGQCPANWTTYSDHCYYFSDAGEPYSWSKANDTCTEMNSTLTSITDAAENDFLQDRLRFQWNATDNYAPIQAFIGLYHHNPCTEDCSLDELRSGWSWLDGENYNSTIYQNWRNDLAHPIKGHQCARLQVRFPERGWSSDSCGGRYGFVCKQALPQTSLSTIYSTTILPSTQPTVQTQHSTMPSSELPTATSAAGKNETSAGVHVTIRSVMLVAIGVTVPALLVISVLLAVIAVLGKRYKALKRKLKYHNAEECTANGQTEDTEDPRRVEYENICEPPAYTNSQSHSPAYYINDQTGAYEDLNGPRDGGPSTGVYTDLQTED